MTMATENTDDASSPPERRVGRLEPVRLDMAVLSHQVESLSAALLRLLDAREAEAGAFLAFQAATENFTISALRESLRHLMANVATTNAEKEARALLATLKTPVSACPHGVPHRWTCEHCETPNVRHEPDPTA